MYFHDVYGGGRRKEDMEVQEETIYVLLLA